MPGASGRSPVDPYRELGLSANAAPDAARRAFRELAKREHPDVVLPTRARGAAERFQRIKEAYDEIVRRAARRRSGASSRVAVTDVDPLDAARLRRRAIVFDRFVRQGAATGACSCAVWVVVRSYAPNIGTPPLGVHSEHACTRAAPHPLAR